MARIDFIMVFSPFGQLVEVDQPHKHSLVLRTGERDYVLCGNDVLDLEDWYEALQQSIQ